MSAELQHAYLKAMGLPLYVPRFCLPGAKPSVRAEYAQAPEPPRDAVAESKQPLETGAPNIDTASARRALGELTASKDSPAEKPVEKRSATAATAETERSTALRFTASLVDSGIGIRFLADCSNSDLSPASKRLVANIARAMARHWQREQQLSLSATVFDWPIVKVPGLLTGEEEAREALSAYLIAQRGSTVTANVVIVFGDSLRPYVDGDYLAAHSAKLIQAPSVEVLQTRPGAKAELWAALRAVQTSV
ncbi:MAG: hypothetical protein ACPHBL_00490 [Spongiibacter marinus]|uniref:hypothetical protein n=1 Tax=Spongiibacter marinus TaxID=354246 RepID=UPI003C513A1C